MSLSAQDRPPEGMPPDGRKEEGGRKKFKGRDEMMGRPILMAGDPRFQKMLFLALVDPDQIEHKIQEWPGYAEMDEDRRQGLLKHLESFRGRLVREALKEAGESGLSIPEERTVAYVRSYWRRRAKVEGDIRKEVDQKIGLAMKEEMDALKHEFSAATQAAKPER